MGERLFERVISEAEADAAMDRYACGDNAAFRTVVAFVSPKLHAFALRRLHDPAAADDIVQQALINIHRARGDFATGARVLPWAFTITRGVLIDHLRRHGRERRLHLRAAIKPVPFFATSPDARFAAKEVAANLRATVAALPAPQRDALVLRETGVSLADAARQTRTTITAMKLRLHRALARLRACFGDDDERKTP